VPLQKAAALAITQGLLYDFVNAIVEKKFCNFLKIKRKYYF